MNERFSLVKPLFIILFAVVIGILYWRGANEQMVLVNKFMGVSDQSAYMNYARQMVESNYTFTGGRNRMPVYPFLQSLFIDPGMSDDDLFFQGKRLNLLLSLVLLAGIAFIFGKYLNWLHAINLILIVTFTVFIFKAGFFQAELLFYFLNFCLFFLMWRMLHRPSLPVAILTGIVAGLAHLTKASIIPGLVIFLASFGLDWLIRITRGGMCDTIASFRERAIFLQPILAAIFVLCFLAVVFPYIQTSKQVFGHYFYNVNSTFYFWYDTWEQVKQGTNAHGDRVGWPDMPTDEIPTMSKYLREHTARQIYDRFRNGAILITSQVANSYGYFKYVVFYATVLIAALVKYRARTIQFVRSDLSLSIFLALYFFAYFLLYAWFSPMVDGGNRLILAQFLPLLFTIAVGLHHLLSGAQTRIFSYQFDALTLINLVMLVYLIFDVHFILTERINMMYGGY